MIYRFTVVFRDEYFTSKQEFSSEAEAREGLNKYLEICKENGFSSISGYVHQD